eukprot:TRINITY_DN80287_c0_g1_i1.p1 TRINITY_DN80287_c0_g1~~TRINITY_DN80287_c0_g1_i1.p1  ORF type:complete len:214 (-),score=30.92 TRINITY_DN80287_c0_g1_i1:211-852(-)
MAAAICSRDHPTSVMIQNIPSRATAQEMMCKIDDLGFHGHYDFFFLPCRASNVTGKLTQCNQGFAFINFKQPTTSERFMEVLRAERVTLRSSSKMLCACYAHVQGTAALIKCTRNHKDSSALWVENPETCKVDSLNFLRSAQLHGIRPDVPTTTSAKVDNVFSGTRALRATGMHLMPEAKIAPASPESGRSPMYIPLDYNYYEDVTIGCVSTQ